MAIDALKDKTRIQLELNPSQLARWNWIIMACEFGNRKELMNNAISVLFWAIREVVNGRVIGSLDPQTDDFKELTTPAFDSARQNAEAIGDFQSSPTHTSVGPTKAQKRGRTVTA